MTTPPADGGLYCDKEPGERSQAWMAALGTGLLLGGAGLGVALLALRGHTSGVWVFTARKMLALVVGTTVVTIATLALHELLHGLGMLMAGARPRFGAGVMSPGLPYLYTTSDGHRFRRLHYVAIAAFPNVAINLGLLALILWGPEPAWWVIPFAVHLSGGVGDMWLCWAAYAEQTGTLIEDQRAGIRVHRRSPRVSTR